MSDLPCGDPYCEHCPPNPSCVCSHGRWDHIGEDDTTSCAWVGRGCSCQEFLSACAGPA